MEVITRFQTFHWTNQPLRRFTIDERYEHVSNGLYRDRGGYLHHGSVCPANREAAQTGWRRPVLFHVVSLFDRSAALAGLRLSGPRGGGGVGECNGDGAGAGIDCAEGQSAGQEIGYRNTKIAHRG